MVPPTNPWTRNSKSGPNVQNAYPLPGDSVVGGLRSPQDGGSSSSSVEYAQKQDEEVEVLRAIYMDDYEEVEVKGAWTKRPERAFRLQLRAASNHDVSVHLVVKLTATYPKTVPLLSLEGVEGIRHASRKELDKIIQQKANEMVGEVMIYELCTLIQDVLEDDFHARARENLGPSLIEERALHEATATQIAMQEQEAELKRKEEEKAEEERVLKQMLDEEIGRRLGARRKERGPQVGQKPKRDKSELALRDIAFDRPISVQDDGVTIEFNAVTGLTNHRKGHLTETFTVRPVIAEIVSPMTFALKQLQIKGQKSNEAKLKKAILQFENELETLKRLRQSNIISVIDFKIEKLPISSASDTDEWRINILTEFANKGSLGEMLELVGQVPVTKVRSWSIDLLEALDFLHRNGIVHQDIHANNVLLSRTNSGGSIMVKLADAAFQARLYDMRSSAKSSPKTYAARSAFWLAPELAQAEKSVLTRKTDVWDLGVVILQMLFGMDTLDKYDSPAALLEKERLSEPLEDLIRKLFKNDPRKRPSAFDLIPSEFLRNDISIYAQPVSPRMSRHSTSGSIPTPQYPHPRQGSNTWTSPFSRYASEWIEAGRLGKGGYGEVVKARNKLDGRIYAIKKITQNSTTALTDVLSEVMLLSRLNHPYVVRYYTAWPEEEIKGSSETDEEALVFSEEGSFPSPRGISAADFGPSTGGLDFVSSSGFPKIEFGNDSDSEVSSCDSGDNVRERDPSDKSDEDEEDSEDSGHRLDLRRTRSSARTSRLIKSTLYIQMEYCERHTLRDLIRKGLSESPEDAWRLLRQILEGLAHIHSHGIIHRDLKPDNIFIDVANSPRIGDFGLATSGQYHLADKAASVDSTHSEMTRSIGTALYVAPELRSAVGGNYTDKVDLYSLGIIFFEMCYPLKTAMERDQTIRKLREKNHSLPHEFESPEMALQKSIITSLISHRPSERPSSAELLRSGKLPLQIEDDTIREALRGLSDSSSPYFHRMMSALFSQTRDKVVKDAAWDFGITNASQALTTNDMLLQSLVKNKLTAVFRRHGALESDRQILFPRSAHYSNSNVVQLLDASGTLLQLPYDLTLPHARTIAKQIPAVEKVFLLGTVYRENHSGGAPRTSGEADFDIISYGTMDLALKEAEVLKVIDEVIEEFPSLSSMPMCFHLNHSDLLECVMDFCHIGVADRPAVKQTLSKLNIQSWTWQKVRNELRSPNIGIPSTSLDELSQFDFRDIPEKAFIKLRSIFEGTEYIEKTQAIFAHLASVEQYTKQFSIRRKVYICPLSSFNEKFYRGGILFQCLYDTKKRDVLAAGGRYDKLIEEHRPKGQGHFTGCRAVGMNLGWDRIVTSMARYQKSTAKSGFLKKGIEVESTGNLIHRRCDALVACFYPPVLRSAGVKLVADLWAHDISAELAEDARSPEELMAHYKEDNHSWIIIIKAEASGTGKPDLKVKSMARKEDTDVRSTDLMSYLRAEIREREQREDAAERARWLRQSSQSESTVSNRKNRVQVLMAQHRSKKINKWNIIDAGSEANAAQNRTRDILDSYLAAPIVAIETRDDVVELIRQTRLSDPDGWRRVIQSVPLADRQYLQQVYDILCRSAAKWQSGSEEATERVAFVYNFRTGGCVLYDLGL